MPQSHLRITMLFINCDLAWEKCNLSCMDQLLWSDNISFCQDLALRVPPTVTRLTVYCWLHILPTQRERQATQPHTHRGCMDGLRRFSRIWTVRIDHRQKRVLGMVISCRLQSGVVRHTLGPDPVRTLGSLRITILHYKLWSRKTKCNPSCLVQFLWSDAIFSFFGTLLFESSQ